MARFHLGNGAPMHDIPARAEMSATGVVQSGGTMVNYRYDLGNEPQPRERSASSREALQLSMGARKAVG